MTQLANGDRLPRIDGRGTDGSMVDISAELADRWSVLLIYRGDW